jgi:hypothetical protein
MSSSSSSSPSPSLPATQEIKKGGMTPEERKILTKAIKKKGDLRSKDVQHHFPNRTGHALGRFIMILKNEGKDTNEKTKTGFFFFSHLFTLFTLFFQELFFFFSSF